MFPPSPYGTSDIALTDRMSIGTSKSVTVGTANKIALVLFDGTAGQRVSLKVSTGVLAFVTLYNHDVTTLGIASAGSAETFIEPVTLPVTGTYTILVDPVSTSTGTLTLTLYDVVDLSGSMTASGSSQTVTLSTPGQVARLSFSGTSGQRVSLKVGTGPIGAVSLVGPDRSTIASLSINPALTSFIDTQTLPMTGTYAVVVDYSTKQTGSVILNLYTVPADVTSAITAGGSGVTLTTTTPGQNGIATFTGTSGHRMSILISGVTAGTVVVSLRDPNGATLTSLTVAVLGGFIEPQTLSASGTHTIVADPGGSSTGSVTLTLYDTPADVTSTITAGGSGVTLTTTPGQNGSVTFTGTSGHRMSILISSVSAGTVVVTLRDPSGASLTSLTVGFLGGFIEPKTLSASGTHTIVADPSGAGAGSVTLTLYDTPADVSGTLTVNGAGTAVTLSTAGQNASYTFSGTASQLVTVRITSNTVKTPANVAGLVTVKLVRANGTVLTTMTSSAASFNLTQQTLPATETYTVVIDPAGANTGGLTVSVTNP